MSAVAAIVVGRGVLADAIAGRLGGRCILRVDSEYGEEWLGPARLEASFLLVAANDSWDTDSHAHIRSMARRTQVAWLPVRAELGRVAVGPIEVPGQPGCATCFELRRRRAALRVRDMDAVWDRHGSRLAHRPSTWLTRLGAESAALLVEAEMAVQPAGPSALPMVRYVDLVTLEVTTHRFLPDPLCPECGSLPADTAATAQIELSSRPKASPRSYRLRRLDDALDELKRTYVDVEAGLIRSLTRGTAGSVAVATAPIRLRSDDVLEPGFGRSRSYRNSEVTAILEALERYAGDMPGGRRTAVLESYASIADDAVDPRTLGEHPAENYDLEGFPFRPFRPDARCPWVWGFSLRDRRPILVPEFCAYYRPHPTRPEEQPFFYEISNGCALGSCLEEATLHALLEIAERDAFLLTWYARMPAPRIDLASAPDPDVQLQASAISADTGYEIAAFDVTVDHRIPCVWAMALRPAESADGPKVVCAAGAHLSAEVAILNALTELAPMLADLVNRWPREASRAARMASNPSSVIRMEDHATTYGADEAFDRLSFLVENDEATEVSAIDAICRTDAFHNGDLLDDLLATLSRFFDNGLDVIVVDQTSAELQAGGFRCVKAIVPGALPMTFGHAHRRTEGLPRLHTVPAALGRGSARLNSAAINPQPHPFP